MSSHRDPKCCLTPFKEIQSNSGRNLICPGIFFLAIPPIFGSTKRVPYIFLNKCTSYIEKCGSLCHLITKYADGQKKMQHTRLVFFATSKLQKKGQICLTNTKFKCGAREQGSVNICPYFIPKSRSSSRICCNRTVQ